MINKNVKTMMFTMVFGMFCLNNICIATETAKIELNKYPDYACEFNGVDKYENFNRKMFNFNTKANKYVLKPINTLWASLVPKCAMERVKNCYTNIEYPKRMVSCLLQKDFKSTGKETARFIINSTIGLGGMFDPAKNKFKIEPTQEDIEQALSNYNIKKGPYLVLPFASPSNVRGYLGKVLDCGLNPSTYCMGVGPIIARGGFLANRTSYSQALIKNIEDSFADPYEITKKLYGIDNYIKNSNFDRKEVLAKIVDGQNIEYDMEKKTSLKSDMVFEDYDPQSPVVDSMRTSIFELPKSEKSFWNELSIWNRSFNKKIKSAEVNIDPERDNYKFRYILQKNKNAPIAIVYPSIGEGAFSHHPVVFAKIFHDAGYSVIIQGNAFHWAFVKSAPKDYKPGLPSRDAQYTRIMTSKILEKLKDKEKINPCSKTIVGTSYGGLTTLFVAAQEEEENILNVSKYISLSPPIDLVYALKKLDSYSEKCNKNGAEVQERTAIAASKLMKINQVLADDASVDNFQTFPLTEEEGIIATNFIMRQKLSDVIFTVEGISKNKKTAIYNQINNMNYSNYFEKYLAKNNTKPNNELNYEMSLYSIQKFLTNSDKYKIYEAMDDYYTNEQQLNWLKTIGSNKVVLLKNGSHLGFLYRKEFQDSFKKDIFVSNIETIQKAKKTDSKRNDL